MALSHTAVCDTKRFLYVVVGNQDSDILVFQFPYNLLDIFYGNRVDTGKRFVKHDEFGVDGKTTGNLCTAALTSRQLVTFIFAYLLQTELCNQAFEFLFLIYLPLFEGGG